MVKILLVENKLSIYIFKECNKIMKKKIAVLFLASILALSATACTTKESTETGSTETVSTSSVASSSDVDVKSLLQKSYLDIVKNGKFYTDFTIDTSSSSISTSSLSNTSSISTSNESTTSSKLKFVIAIDTTNQKLYIDTNYPMDGYQRIIIADGKQWKFDDTNKTAYFASVSDDVKSTLDNMTSGLMDSTENINYASDSIENFNGKECYAVVYNVKSTVSLAEGISMSSGTDEVSTEQTYYFDKETQKLVGIKLDILGMKLSVVVNELTATIPDNLFTIPSDYKKSEMSSMMSSASAQ